MTLNNKNNVYINSDVFFFQGVESSTARCARRELFRPVLRFCNWPQGSIIQLLLGTVRKRESMGGGGENFPLTRPLHALPPP